MSDTAFQIQYRQEFIAAFEQHQSIIRDTVTTEAVIKGQKAVFLVAGSNDSTAVTRGVNGQIPARADDNAQNTATLQEWHDLVRKTGFNVFASQGNQRAIMQMTTMGVINRKVDDQISTLLNTGTVTLGSATTVPNIPLVQNAIVKLQNADVPWDSNVTLLCQPSFLSYLEEDPAFASADYVDARPYASNDGSWRDRPMGYRWRNMLVITHPNLPGKATTGAKTFLYHKNAVGHAMDTGGMQQVVGYDEEQDYSYARCSTFMGGVVLQNAGIININHDGSQRA